MDTTIQVRERGVVTLPAELREKYGLRTGDSFRLVDLDGVFVLTPLVPMVPELAREIGRLRIEAGLSTDDLLLVESVRVWLARLVEVTLKRAIRAIMAPAVELEGAYHDVHHSYFCRCAGACPASAAG